MEEFISELKDRGYKITPQRREILRVLIEAKGHQSAQEVHDGIRERFPDVSLDTVYRNLRLLTELGLVNQVNFKSTEVGRFELDDKEAHHHHLVCLGCGRVLQLDYCPIGTREASGAGFGDFRVVDHAFEVYGYCGECQLDRAARV